MVGYLTEKAGAGTPAECQKQSTQSTTIGILLRHFNFNTFLLKCQASFPNSMRLDIMTRKKLTKLLKTIWGAHHFVVFSRDPADIAEIINVSPQRLEKLMETPFWKEALQYWRGNASAFEEQWVGDLGFAQHIWIEIIEKDEHINTVDYPDVPFKCKKSEGDPALYPLIQSHLFCVDNLSKSDVRICSEFDNSPARYKGQELRGYHWFAYPNRKEGIYSKVFARVNIVGDLVIDYSEDNICFVCIRHGRLTITRQVSDDVVNVSDKRLRVCL